MLSKNSGQPSFNRQALARNRTDLFISDTKRVINQYNQNEKVQAVFEKKNNFVSYFYSFQKMK